MSENRLRYVQRVTQGDDFFGRHRRRLFGQGHAGCAQGDFTACVLQRLVESTKQFVGVEVIFFVFQSVYNVI